MPRNGSGNFSLVTNSWNPAINGTPATASDWQSLIDDVAAAMTQSISRDGQTTATGNLPMGGNKLTGLGPGTAAGDSLRWEQLFSQGQPQDLASAATTDIGAQMTTFLNITGTTTITSFGANFNGPRYLRFSGILTLTHSATLVLPGGANITTAAGDTAIAIPLGTPAAGWRVLSYQAADGGARVLNINGGQVAGMRNKIINGDMSIWQEGTATRTAAPNGTYGADCWATRTQYSGGSTAILYQTTGPNQEFPYAVRLRHDGATAGSLAWYAQRQTIEKSNARGLVGASNITISFWYRSNRTGGHAVSFDAGNTGTAFTGAMTEGAVTFNVAAANTWELKKVTFPITITGNGTDPDNGIGMFVNIGFVNGGINNFGTILVNDYFDLTGVQLEVGTIATPFERRLYSVELDMCMRYFENCDFIAVGEFYSNIYYKQPKRSVPTVARVSGATITPNPRGSLLYFSQDGGVAAATARYSANARF